MNPIVKLAVVAAFGATCAACSHGGAPAQAAKPSAAPASSRAPTPTPSGPVISMVAPASGTSSSALTSPPVTAPTLAESMQRPAFAEAFDAMDGASSLPAWTKRGGVALASKRVEVDGESMWLAQTCQAQGCQTGRLFVLIDPATHAMHGLLVKASGRAGAHVQRLTWLGKPDATVRSFLKQHVSND